MRLVSLSRLGEEEHFEFIGICDTPFGFGGFHSSHGSLDMIYLSLPPCMFAQTSCDLLYAM